MISLSKKFVVRGMAEIVIIATGIILAISADAWWQDRIDRQAERLHLDALQADFARSLLLLDEVEAGQRLQVGYLQSLLSPDVISATATELRLWMDDGFFNIGTYIPQLAALQDLESSGQMHLIQNAAIRRSLAKVQQILERFEGRQADLIDSQQILLDTYLVDEIDLASILTDDGDLPEPLVEPAILQSTAFRSRVTFKLTIRQMVSNSQRELRQQIEHAMKLIEVALGNSSA